MQSSASTVQRLVISHAKWRYGSFRSQHIQHHDGRQRLSAFWKPRPQHRQASEAESRNATSLLEDAGFVYRAHAGIYHFLPLGQRVLDKIERLIDYHMRSVGASKLSLSSLSAQSLWQKSGRLENSPEIYRFRDRSHSKWLLAPTHEEEITQLLIGDIIAPSHLPVRLYQIGRKYRDELRTRGGLLRGKEFVMKDLYTFDATSEAARQTYEMVREAYNNLFRDLGIPYAEARADSGNMGGDLSHEFHFLHESGEDNVITCSSCGEVRNEEFVPTTSRLVQDVAAYDVSAEDPSHVPADVRDFISKDDAVLVRVILPNQEGSARPEAALVINPYAVKEAMTDLAEINTGIEEHQVMHQFENRLHKAEECTIVYLVDSRVTEEQLLQRLQQDRSHYGAEKTKRLVVRSPTGATLQPNSSEEDQQRRTSINLLKLAIGDQCPHCEKGTVSVQKAIEIGHTFHLGTRYSSKLGLALLPDIKGGIRTPVEMGCHGIGVSRLIAAAVACLAHKDDIRWPDLIAPYNVLIGTGNKVCEEGPVAERLYDALSQAFSLTPRGHEHLQMDVVIDDRSTSGYAAKLKDAGHAGYPVIVMLGKEIKDGMADVRCPRVAYRQMISLDDVPRVVQELLERKDPEVLAV